MVDLEVPLESVHSFNNVPGWIDSRILEDLRLRCQVACRVANIGVWKGRSVCAIASALSPGNVVYAIDRWQDSPVGSLSIFEEFLTYARHLNLSDRIVPIIMDSIKASSLFDNNSLDLVFIDGDHDFESCYNDLLAWHHKVKPGGVFCGDGFDLPGVSAAVSLYAQALGLTVQSGINDAYWIVER